MIEDEMGILSPTLNTRPRDINARGRFLWIGLETIERNASLMTDIDIKVRHITPRGANLFSELGFPPADARRLHAVSRRQVDEASTLKEKLMGELAAWIATNGLKQEQAAAILNITRRRVSDVVSRKAAKFTIDALVAMLVRVEKQVPLVVGSD